MAIYSVIILLNWTISLYHKKVNVDLLKCYHIRINHRYHIL